MTRQVQYPADKKAEALRAATREANETLADLKRTLKEASKLVDEIKEMIDDRCEEKVETAVSDSLARLATATNKAIEDATEGIFSRFDKLEGMIFEGRKGNKTTGGKSIESMIQDKITRDA